MKYIPSKLVKCFNEDILFALSHIFNQSFIQGKFIECFKIAKVILIHKSGSKNDINNYRPVTLLSSLSKVLEKLVYNTLYGFLSKHNIPVLFEAQFRFKKKKIYQSSGHVATILVEKITQSFICKKKALGVFLDLSKAFDTIKHKILLSKLYHCGILVLEVYLMNGLKVTWLFVSKYCTIECAETLSSICIPYGIVG